MKNMSEVKNNEIQQSKILAENYADAPNEYCCPITHQVFKEPMKASDGYTYERIAIQKYFAVNSQGVPKSPKTDAFLKNLDLIPDVAIKKIIEDYKAKKAEEKFKILQSAATAGDVNAMKELGICYEFGKGIAKDTKQAAECYKKAADKGNAEAECYLALCYDDGIGVEKNEEKALKLYKSSASKYSVSALRFLGNCYEHGLKKEITKDEKQAFKLYGLVILINKDDMQGQYHMGRCYSHGIGVPKDFKKAAEFYKLAAKQGLAEAQHRLEIFYNHGIGGVTKDFKTTQVLGQNAKQNDEDAKRKVVFKKK